MLYFNSWNRRMMMSFAEMSAKEFTEVLASKARSPEAEALRSCRSNRTALGSMVGNLTVGKKKYAESR
jgi:formiminotetrahydrofolate cyclodeaminase